MNRKTIIVLAVALIALLLFSTTLFSMFPAANYGDIGAYKSHDSTQTLLDSTSVIDADIGDYLVVWLFDDPDTSRRPTEITDMSATLYRSNGDVIESGSRTTSGTSYAWVFYLRTVPQGTFTYSVKLFGRLDPFNLVSGETNTFSIKSSTPPDYEDVDIFEAPQDNTYSGATSVTWKFNYDGPCTAKVMSQNQKLFDQDYEASTAPRIVTISLTSEGIYRLTLTVTPVDTSDQPAEDEAVITIESTTTTTTTTPTTTTTTTTTPTDTTTTTTPGTTTSTTTTGEEPLAYDYSYLVLFVVSAVIVVIVLKRKRLGI